MGTFRVEIGVGNPLGGDLLPVSALVDTGATHSMMPASALEGLWLVPSRAAGGFARRTAVSWSTESGRRV